MAGAGGLRPVGDADRRRYDASDSYGAESIVEDLNQVVAAPATAAIRLRELRDPN